MTELTIIIATYNRPDALKVAISAAQAQHFQDWKMLVIGDMCAAETGQTLSTLDDSRIHYVNLPARCGEQSGPNSVGMALVDTPYLALLNHDDIWTPDHLSVAMKELRSGIDFYCGRAAFCRETGIADHPWAFTECSPVKRSLEQTFYKPFYLFESVSSWVLRSKAAQRVGPWRSATEIYRKPIVDWLLRAWRSGLVLKSGPDVSVLKPKELGRGTGAQYGKDSSSLKSLALMATRNLDELRTLIDQDIEKAIHIGASRHFNYYGNGLEEDERRNAETRTQENALAFLETGIDAYEEICAAQGLTRGNDLRGALRHRTGEELEDRPELEAMIAYAREQLSGPR